MSALGDVLELMHGAPERFTSVRLELREWRHTARAETAWRRRREFAERCGGMTYSVIVGGAEEPPEVTESHEHILWQRPDRLRQEWRDGPAAPRLLVVNGERWWSYDAWRGATTNVGSDMDVAAGESPPHPTLLDPAIWLASVTLEVFGPTRVAGRGAITLRARPRPPRKDEVHGLAWGADHHEVAIDAERGVALRIVSLIDGEPFVVTEVTSIAFDEPLAADAFVFTPPAGEDVRPVDWPQARPVTIDEAAREAPFTVLAPRRVPQGAEVSVHYMPGSSRPAQSAWVTLHYATKDLGVQVSVSEAAAEADGDLDIAEPAETLVRHGVGMRVRELGGQRQVALERHGTRVMLVSESAPLETLLEMADSLVPAPAEPPPLVDAG